MTNANLIIRPEEHRDSKYHIPELSFVAELDGEIVGHFLFSHFPLSSTPEGGHREDGKSEIVMLAPVSVHADYFRQGVGFRTSSEYGIYPTEGWPMEHPEYMMCQETYEGSLNGFGGYIVYDMYYNA